MTDKDEPPLFWAETDIECCNKDTQIKNNYNNNAMLLYK